MRLGLCTRAGTSGDYITADSGAAEPRISPRLRTGLRLGLSARAGLSPCIGAGLSYSTSLRSATKDSVGQAQLRSQLAVGNASIALIVEGNHVW